MGQSGLGVKKFKNSAHADVIKVSFLRLIHEVSDGAVCHYGGGAPSTDSMC